MTARTHLGGARRGGSSDSTGGASLARTLILAALLPGLTGCLTFTWQRTTSQRALEASVVEKLPAAGADLALCLELLGAPVAVRENRVQGLLLVYAWENARSRGLSASVPFGNASAGLSYSSAHLRAEGLALWFDADWRLVRWEEGRFADLLERGSSRPASVQDIEGA